MREMHVLGMDLTDYSVREALRKVDDYLTDVKINTISFLSMDVLMQAAESEELRTYLTSVDLTVPISAEILNAAGITGGSRIKEVEEGKFYRELLKKISDGKKSAFLLARKQETIESFSTYLKNYAPGISIVGGYSFENWDEDSDTVVNEINSTFPDVVFSRLGFPEQEKFVYENGSKLNSKLWVSLKEEFATKEPNLEGAIHKLRKKLHSLLFKLRLNRFKKDDNNTGEN